MDTFAFADDIAIVAQGKKKLEEALDTLEQWSEENKMTINHSKSAILIIRADRKTRNDMTPIHGIPIKTEYKYLGLEISDCADARALLDRLKEQ